MPPKKQLKVQVDPEPEKIVTTRTSARVKKAEKDEVKVDAVVKTATSEPAPRGKRGAKKEEPQDTTKDEAPKKSKKDLLKDTTQEAPKQKTRKKDDLDLKPQKSDETEPDVKKLLKTEEEKPYLKKVIVKGGAIVDEFVFNKEKYHVLVENGIIYDCMMNQTNIVGNSNNNKFYVCQVLVTDTNSSTPQYYAFNRWGRVGVQGQQLMRSASKEDCIQEYQAKVREKSVKGDYRILERDYTPQEDPALLKKREEEAFEKSKLHIKVRELVRLIFDMKMINKQMVEIGYDPKKMPLGKLAKSTIQKGFSVLEQISSAIKRKASQADFERLTSEFYSQIPHDFGFQQAPIIKTDQDVKKKLDLLESIQQIQVVTKILDEDKGEGNLVDSHYEKLQCDIKHIGPGTEKFKLIETYVHNTHAKTHANYSLDIEEIFELDKELDKSRFQKDIGNRMLLWHGSRLTNYVGILSQGLRIAPPEAPVTGYMFGKGVYFADMVSKSANYCGTSRDNNTGLILLCDVALGNFSDKYYSDYNAHNLPPGCHSTRGCGKTAPPEHTYVDHDGMKIPIGQGEAVQLKQPGALLYNEYIVYDVKQVQFKYLIKLKFNYK